MTCVYEFWVFEGSPHARTVQIPELTAENHTWWFKHVRFTLEMLKLTDHIDMEISECQNQDDQDYFERWLSDRYDVWQMLAIPAWSFLTRIEAGDDETRNTYNLYQSLMYLFATGDGADDWAPSGWQTPDVSGPNPDCTGQLTGSASGQGSWTECADHDYDHDDAATERSGWTVTYQEGTYQDGRD